jgi:beta-lactamase class D
MRLIILLAFLTSLAPSAADARTLCTLVAEHPSGRILLEDGECRTRTTPASTFKIPLALLGFDAAILQDAHAPVLTIRQGEADWGGKAWREPTDPESWLRNSVVWYSQRITHELGATRFSSAVRRLGYGNMDVAGDAGRDNGLDRSWIGSSLKVSPVEQVTFLNRLLAGTLPFDPVAQRKTIGIVEAHRSGDWTVRGKTGSAFPRRADGNLDRSRGWGWYVGWATTGERTLVFARLNKDDRRDDRPAGLRARSEFLQQWPALSAGLAP